MLPHRCIHYTQRYKSQLVTVKQACGQTLMNITELIMLGKLYVTLSKRSHSAIFSSSSLSPEVRQWLPSPSLSVWSAIFKTSPLVFLSAPFHTYIGSVNSRVRLHERSVIAFDHSNYSNDRGIHSGQEFASFLMYVNAAVPIVPPQPGGHLFRFSVPRAGHLCTPEAAYKRFQQPLSQDLFPCSLNKRQEERDWQSLAKQTKFNKE